MFTVDLSTFIAAITVLVSVIFFLIIIKSKPKKSQVEEMQDAGAEIVEQIQQCIRQFEEEKIQLEKKISEIKDAQSNFLKESNLTIEKKNKVTAKKENNSEIVRMHREGHTIEEIAKLLNVQRGIIEVSLNFEKLEAR